jgi:hypothetical protein
MSPGLRALLAGVIDYAGLFPPARLPLDQAIRCYADYRQSADAWMLGRFVCPAARLPELTPFLNERSGSGPPFVFSALGRGGDDRASFRAGLSADLAALAFFRAHLAGVVDSFEVRLPASLAISDPDCLRSVADADDTALEAVYVEVPLDDDWMTMIPMVADRLRAANEGRSDGRRAGFKLRCGGLEAAAFPSVSEVAAVLKIGREARIPLKFTAGLHHPLPRLDPATGATMHGFVNVFVAAALEWLHGLDPGALAEILADADPESFAFDADGLRWQSLRVAAPLIEEARRDLAVSFGSCSFDEPRDDLRALGWM